MNVQASVLVAGWLDDRISQSPPTGSTRSTSTASSLWFRRSTSQVLSETQRETILLSLGDGDGADAEGQADGNGQASERSPGQAGTAATVTMRLFDRLSGPGSSGRAALHRSLVAIRDRGRGAVVVRFDDRDHAEP